MVRFILGSVAGGAAAYYWRDTIAKYVNDAIPGMRDRAAERLGGIGEQADRALDRARARIRTAVRAGQDKLRTVGTSGATRADTARPAPETGAAASETAADWVARNDRPITPHDWPEQRGRVAGQ